ncbi:hypothetical protein [Lelliottia amnigena]|uniref:hypothetical protein n=1 Tax=Lelliottia amnigena TaxID=61646 RepID=UPI001C233608|nr:hypothetical protein [Lelliottia amnigena]QXB24144.1 hypothetical protein I6L76_23040 [Lelliottia amnigena]
MSQVSTYSAFRCNDSIVVFHQHGHGVPQALLIFREPQRMAIHDKKLIAFYTFSKEAETLLEDPQHDAAEVLNAIALQIKVQGQAVMKRRLKSLALVVAGAMFASVIWMTGTPEYSPFHSVSTAQQIPTVQTAAQPAPVQMNMATPLTTGKTFSQAAQTEEQNMQSIMQDSRNALPASPSEVLQTPATAGTAPVTNVTTAKAEVTSQSGRQQMVDILKRSTDRGLFTVSLSSGHERTLYAFLDPTCAVCRSMEPAIEQLAQHYNVVIFPVSVVNDGGDAVDKIIPVLCQKDQAIRAAGWSALFRPDAGMSVPGQEATQQVNSDCVASATAVVGVNDIGFRKFGFAGTPTVLTDTGIRLATGMLTAPDKIDHFLKITDPMTSTQVDSFIASLSIQE